MIIGKVICLFMGLVYMPKVVKGILNTEDIGSIQMAVWAAGVTGFISLQWLVSQ